MYSLQHENFCFVEKRESTFQNLIVLQVEIFLTILSYIQVTYIT